MTTKNQHVLEFPLWRLVPLIPSGKFFGRGCSIKRGLLTTFTMNYLLVIATVSAATLGSKQASTKFTCPTTFNSNKVPTATAYDLNFGTTCCKTVGYVFTKNGRVVRGTDHNPLKC